MADDRYIRGVTQNGRVLRMLAEKVVAIEDRSDLGEDYITVHTLGPMSFIIKETPPEEGKK